MTTISKSVVLLHGWPGTSADYHLVRELLPQDVSVYTPDLLGYGEGFTGPVTLEQATAGSHADRIIDLIVNTGIELPVIGGYDIGSRIAQAIAVKAPELVGGLVVTPGYAGIGDRVSAPELQHIFWYQQFHRLELAGDILDGNREAVASYINHFLKSWSYKKGIVTGDRFEQLISYYARPNAFRASVVWYQANKGYSGTDPIDVPTTMLWPKQDPLFSIEWADRFSEYFTNASLEPVPDCGHFVPLESPAIFAQNLLNHLNS